MLSNVKLCGKTLSHVICVHWLYAVYVMRCSIKTAFYPPSLLYSWHELCAHVYVYMQSSKSIPFLFWLITHYLKKGLVVCQHWKQASQDPTSLAAQVGVKLMWKSISRVAKNFHNFLFWFCCLLEARMYAYGFQLDA